MSNRPKIDHGLTSLEKIDIPFGLFPFCNFDLVKTPAVKGNSTYSPTEMIKVSHGTDTSLMPNRKAAIGAKANIIMTSFIETCTKV